MKLASQIEIDILQFFKTGKFDYIKLGQTKEWIVNNFPDPDATNKINHNSSIWFYGNIELHFDKEELFLIFSEHIDTLNGGQNLNLKKWILEKPETFTLPFVIENLNKERIDFKLKHVKATSGLCFISIELILSNVHLNFNLAERDDEDFESYLVRCKTDDSNSLH